MNREKKVDDLSKGYEEYREIVKDALKLHDKLSKIGLDDIAKDALKIYNNLLEIKEKEAKSYINEEKTSLFLRDEMGYIYGTLGSRNEISENEISVSEPLRSKLSEEDLQKDKENYLLFLQNIRGSIGLWLNENLVPIFIDGAIKEITGYNKEDFHSMNLKWTELVLPEDLTLVLEHIEWVKSNPNSYAELEYRIRRKNGKIRWVREVTHVLPEDKRHQGTFQSFVQDINERKKAEERKAKFENTQKREIHHRIKNNLQVISSFLDLQAEKLASNKVCDTTQVNEAFRESRNRIASMALIHEELYKSTDADYLDFSEYLKKLTKHLFDLYKGKNNNISLKLNLEQVNLGMDSAIPLGNIVTELISNALKHAFPNGSEGNISIILCKKDNYKQYLEKSENFRTDLECQDIEDLQFVLVIKDNGMGFPQEIDFKNTDSLGLQIVTILVEQIDGCIELKRNNGTEFTIWFKDVEK